MQLLDFQGNTLATGFNSINRQLWRSLMSEEVVISEVSAERIRKDVECIVRELPYRAAGSENGRRMAEYSRDPLQAAGLTEVVVHELPAIVSFPEHAEFRVEAPTELAIQANTLGHSLLTPEDGIRGELVYVGSGAYSDYQGRDVRGKIILTELSYAPARHKKQRIAGQLGAIGAVMMNWGPPDNTAVPFGSVKPVWGNPTPENYKTEMPTLPCIGIARTAGLKLKEMCAAGPVHVWFRTHVENGWRPVQITLGRLPAPPHSPEAGDFILVGGHQDSWFGEAATDNAAGNACKMELARVFYQHREKLRRGLVFGFWTAHETGTMAGSAWFCDRHWDELRKLCRLPPNRSAGHHRHHGVEYGIQCRTESVPHRNRIATARLSYPLASRREKRRFQLFRHWHPNVPGRRRLHRRRVKTNSAGQFRVVAPFH